MYTPSSVLPPPSLPPSLPPPLPGPVSGLNEEDLRASLATVEALTSACGADVSVLRERQGEEGRMADCLVRRRVEEDDFMEVRYIHVHNTLLHGSQVRIYMYMHITHYFMEVRYMEIHVHTSLEKVERKER